MELLGKRKNLVSDSSSPTFNRRPYLDAPLSAQMMQMSLSKPSSHVDFNTQSLLRQLQHQNFGYDIEVTRQKRELTSRLQRLPLPFPARHTAKFSQLVKCIVNANIYQSFRLSAANQAIEMLQQTNDSSGPLKSSTKPNKRGVISTGMRVIEDYLRVLELTTCERHCPEELTDLIANICARLVVRFGMYLPSTSLEEEDDVSSDSSMENNNVLTNATRLAYVSKLMSLISSNESPQFRAGMLSFISRIVALYDPNEPYDSLAAVALISDLVAITDSLNQSGSVHRLARFISLVGDRFDSEFGRHFSDLADILVGWCVDASSIHRGVAVGALLSELSQNLSKWWFDACTDGDEGLFVSESTCGMICHLLEDADSCIQKAVSEFRQICPNNNHNRRTAAGTTSIASSSSRPIASTEMAQNLIAANLHFAVLSGITKGVARVASTTGSTVKFHKISASQWVAYLLNALVGIESLSSAAFASPNPPSASLHKAHVPLAYSLPLLTFGDILSYLHSILLFTVTKMNFDGMPFRHKIACLLSRPPDESVLVLCGEHVRTLCDLAYYLLAQSPVNAPGELISTFKLVVGSESILHRQKTSTTGSADVFALLVKLSRLHLAGCDMLAMITETCISDFQMACTRVAGNSATPEDELLVLFSLSLFVTILKPVSEQPNRVSFVSAANSRIILNLADLHRRFGLCKIISQRIRLCLLVTILSTLNYGVEASGDCASDLLYIAQHFLATASTTNLQELVLGTRLLETLSRPMGTQLSQAWCDYLCRLMSNSQSPVRANCGQVFLKAVDLLIRLTAGHQTAPQGVSRLIALCANHPLPSINSASADLLLALGGRIERRHEVTETADLLLHWFNNSHPEISTSLLTSASVNLFGYSRASNDGFLRTQGSFPSLPAVAGMLGIITRAAPYSSEERTSRLGILSDSHDWLRRLACLVAPLPVDESSSHNWYGTDVSPWAIVTWFSTWSMVEYKLKVAPWANPVRTFLAIEAVVHALLGQLSPGYQSQAPELQSFLSVTSAALGQQSDLRQLRHCAVIIQFLRQMEKTMHNAVDGFALALPCINSTAHGFFRANALTCHQWLNRVRTPLACLASWASPLQLAGSEVPAAVIWSTYSLLYQVADHVGSEGQWLSQLARLGNPEKILIFLIQALRQVGASEELELLHG